MAIDPTNDLTLYLATTIAAGSIWKSTDGGNTWAVARSGLPTTGPDLDYFTLAGGNLYVRFVDKLYKSADRAANCTAGMSDRAAHRTSLSGRRERGNAGG